MDRKGFFKDGIKQIATDLMRTPAGKAVDNRLHRLSNILNPRGIDHFFAEAEKAPSAIPRKPEPTSYPRPPGTFPDPVGFSKRCTGCGDCIVACPHGAIFRLDHDSGPLMNPNISACHLCEDFPCITACDEEALQPLAKNVLPKFGQAILKTGNCYNEINKKEIKSKENACEKCEEACPVEDVIDYDKGFLPHFKAHCTGCGLCVEACPALPVAIEIKW